MHALGAAELSGGPLSGLVAKIAVVAAGLGTGLAGGGALVVVSGLLSPAATSAPTVALYACPDSAAVVEQVPAGQKLLVTARSGAAGWLQVYLPGPAADRAWAHAWALRVEGEVGSLPVAGCGSSAVSAGAPSGATELVSVAGPLVATPTPTPSPTPTPTPVTPPPLLAELIASPAAISGGDQTACPGNPRATEISVTATSSAGVASVTLSYQRPGAGSFATRPMTQQAGTDHWRATLSTDADGIAVAGSLAYYVVATSAGSSPQTARLPATGSQSVAVTLCTSKPRPGPTPGPTPVTPVPVTPVPVTPVPVTPVPVTPVPVTPVPPGPTPGPTPTPTPTPVPPGPTPGPTPTPTPTPAPVDTTGPTLSNLAASPTTIWVGDTGCGPSATTVTVTATDDLSGVSSVTLHYIPPTSPVAVEDSIAMDRVARTTWQKTITAESNWVGGKIVYWVVAEDSARNTSQSGSLQVIVSTCVRPPPVVTITQPPADVAMLGFTGCNPSPGPCYADVNLAANAQDPVDGPLPDTAIAWTTDRTDFQAGLLGKGRAITARLFSTSRCGWETHTITVTVVNSAGKTSTAVRRITIGTIC